MKHVKATFTMDKEALIDIILNDLKEVHALVKTFKGNNELNAAFINLSRTKIANINEELTLLEQLNAQKATAQVSESSLTSAVTITSDKEDNSAIADSAGRFLEGESNIETQVEKPFKVEQKAGDAIETTPEKQMETALPKEEITVEVAEPTITEKPVVEAQKTEVSAQKITEEPVKKKTSPQVRIQAKTDVAQQNNKASVLGEVINKNETSVNEILANKKEQVEDIKQIGKPVTDVRKAFGLNDRFYYQRELFGNDADLFNQTLDQINAMDSYDSAVHFLKDNYSWQDDNEASESFFKSIKRRFI